MVIRLAKKAYATLTDPQVVRYLITGVVTNGITYTSYLLITYLGMEPKRAMSGLYVLAILLHFHLNRRYTFKATTAASGSFLRYLLVSAVGYVLNLLWLMFFVDYLHLPHQLVQAVAIGVMAVYFFVASKYIVHTHRKPVTGES